MSRRRLGLACLGLVAGIVLVACGGASTTSAPSAAPTPLPSGVVALSAKEYEFTPGTATVPAGMVTFAVTNAGTENHEFEVLAGDQSLAKIDAFPRGETKQLTVDLAAGTYTFVCRLNGHDILGMKGTLTVSGG